MSPRSRGRWPRLLGWAAVLAAFGGAAGAAGVATAWSIACRDGSCPSIDVLDAYVPDQTSKLYAADGRFIAELGLERRTLVALDEIPEHVTDAFLAVEDKRFYAHDGIDYVRVAGAAFRNLRAGGYAQGFSTITMQLARNVFPERLTREKTLLRKLKEAKVARAIERRFAKDRILELYLNQIYFGAGAYGVESAAQRYFGKSVRNVTVAEAALLAALPKAPSRYDPRRNPDRAVQRRNTILELMRRDGRLTAQEASLAKAFPLALATRSDAGDAAPYFVEWVRQQLDAQFGRRLYEEGLRVYTTLDVDVQEAAERALEEQLRAIESGTFGPYRHTTYEEYQAQLAEGEARAGAAESPYLQGAFIALDPATGAVRALVGGRDFDDSKYNRAVQALRQPGSTFKPIVYSAAIRAGISPAQVIDDTPYTEMQENGELWEPKNFDLKFEGRVPLRRALYMSRNLPAIRVGLALGPPAVVSLARRFGITTNVPPYPSVFIGSADVYPLEMVAAYTVFANLGVRTTPFAIARVEDADGKVLWEPRPEREVVLTSEEAWLMVSMMKDVIQRGSAYGSTWGAGFRQQAGGKTGTTNDGADVWFIGYTSDLVAGVWMGFDTPRKIKANAQGGRLAAPAWTAFMKAAYADRPAPADWPRPERLVARDIDIRTGRLATFGCTDSVRTEFFIAGTEPTTTCRDVPAQLPSVEGDTATDALLPPSLRDTTSPFRIPPPGTDSLRRRDTLQRRR